MNFQLMAAGDDPLSHVVQHTLKKLHIDGLEETLGKLAPGGEITVLSDQIVMMIVAGLLLGFLLRLVAWRVVFILSAVLTFGVVVLLFFFLKERPEQVGLVPLLEHEKKHGDDQQSATNEAAKPASHPFDPLTLLQVCGQFALSGRFWFICFSLVFLTIMMDFLTFIPIYLTEALDVSPSQASMAGSTFPAGMFAALILTSFVYDRLPKKALVWVLGGMLTVSCLCVMTLWNLDFLPKGIRTPAAIGTIFLLGLTISPAYYIPMSVFSVSFGGTHSGFLVALIDVCGYSGALLFNFFGGSIAQHYGWSVFLSGLLTIAVLATVCTITFLTLDCRAENRRRAVD